MSKSRFRYVIFPDGIYQVTVEDYDGNSSTLEVSGQDIANHFRREKLLDRQFELIYNDSKNGDENEEQD